MYHAIQPIDRYRYAYPYDECLPLPTDLVAINLLYMAAVVTLLVLFVVADLIFTVQRCVTGVDRLVGLSGVLLMSVSVWLCASVHVAHRWMAVPPH